MPSLLESALSYSRLSWAIFPVNITTENKKIPLTPHGFKDATTNESTIRKFFSNSQANGIGFATGMISGIVVLDVDTKESHGKDGIQSLDIIKKEYQEEYGTPFPKTRMARTHTGGLHLYFRALSPFASSNNLRPGLDFKGEGGYVVAPGSSSSFGRYSWDVGSYDYDISIFPNNLYSLLKPKREKFKLQQTVTQGNRHEQLKQFGASLRNYNANYSMILTMLEAYASKMEKVASDPLTVKEIQDIAIWASNLEPTAIKNEIARLTLNPSGSPGIDLTDPTLIDRGLDLMNWAKTEPALSWLVQDIWTEKSRGFLAGHPKVGKTWIGLDLMISIVTGRSFLNSFEVFEPGPCLIIEEETSKLTMGNRLGNLVEGSGFTEDQLKSLNNLILLNQKFIKFPKDTNKIISLIKQYGIKAILIDSFRRTNNAKENSSDELQLVLESLTRIQVETASSVIAIHHLLKSNDDRSSRSLFERMRGSSDLWAWADCIMGLEKDGQAEDRVKTIFQFRDAEVPMPFIIQREILPNNRIIMIKENMEDSDRFKDLVSQIKEIMGEVNKPVTKSGVLDLIKAKKSAKWQVFDWMIGKGLIVGYDKKWHLADNSGSGEQWGTTS